MTRPNTEQPEDFALPAFDEPGVSCRITAPSDVIDVLRHDIRASGMTIREIADKCGVSPSTVWRALDPSGRGKVEMLMCIGWAIGRELRISIVPRNTQEVKP